MVEAQSSGMPVRTGRGADADTVALSVMQRPCRGGDGFVDVRRIRIRLRTLGLPLRGMRIRVLRRVEEALKIIAEPLEECPSCHCVPKVGKSDGEAFLQCPECLKIARGGNPIETKDKWNRLCLQRKAMRLKAKRQAAQLERIIGKDAE